MHFTAVVLLCTDADTYGSTQQARRRFFPTNADVYPSSGFAGLRAEYYRRSFDRNEQSNGLASLYDPRYLSEDPNIRALEVLVLDEICLRPGTGESDPFDLFSGDAHGDGEVFDEAGSSSFLDLSSIPLDNYHVIGEEETISDKPESVLPLPLITLSPIKKKGPLERKPRYTSLNPKRIQEKSEAPEKVKHVRIKNIPAEIETGPRAELMREIRETGHKPLQSRVTPGSDDSFFEGTAEPLSFTRPKKTAGQSGQKRNSLHAHINKPKSTSIMHSDSFREAFSFAMQHRRSKLREDSRSSDVSSDVSNDSYDFM